MTNEKIIFACKEHIENALDDYVNYEEKAPNMVNVTEENHVNCSYCDKEAEYQLLP